MNSKYSTKDAIDSLVELYFSDQKDHRITYLFRESLNNLVRQAKAEQVLEMRQNVDRVTTSRARPNGYSTGQDHRH